MCVGSRWTAHQAQVEHKQGRDHPMQGGLVRPAFQLREDRLVGAALFGKSEAAKTVVPHGIDLAFHDDPVD